MPEKKQDAGFTVTDRRLFTSEGELRTDAVDEKPASAPSSSATVDTATSVTNAEVPPPPTATEQKANADAYHQSAKDLDARVELSGHSSKDLEMTFERFMASLYMSAMLQLGMMHEEGGQPRIDLIGARQTIDTLSLLQEKTTGNLTAAESNFLQNCLYELRMAYVEVTNALARPPQAVVRPWACPLSVAHAPCVIPPIPTTAALALLFCWNTPGRSFSSIPPLIFANRPSANRSTASTPFYTPTATPTTFSVSTTCVP
jgi:hypothetical protein